MENQKPNFLTSIKFFILFAILILISLVSISILKTANKKEELVINQKTVVISPTESIKVKTTGSLTIRSLKNQYSPDQLIEMEIIADSAGNDITGYDLIVAYDPQIITFKEAQSLIDDFKIYSFEEKNYLVLTAIKDLKSQRQTVFSDVRLVKLIFSAKKKSETKVEILPNFDSRETFFVDKNTQKIYPSLPSPYQIVIK